MSNIYDFNDALSPDAAERLRRRMYIDAEEVAVRVRARMVEFVRWLYGNRIIVRRGEGRIGSPRGEKGSSCAIQIDGDQAGLWTDFSDKSSGNLFDLYAIYMGLDRNRDFQRILTELSRDFLGDTEKLGAEPSRSWGEPSPAEKIAAKRAKYGDEPCPNTVELGPPVKTWRYYDLQGNVLALMRRYDLDEIDPETGKRRKTFRPESNGRTQMPSPRPLYRMPDIIRVEEVVLAEGEKSADALVAAGFEATTAMGGANTDLSLVDWTPIKGKRVVVWPDNDSAGLAYGRRVCALMKGLGCEVRVVGAFPARAKGWDAADALDEGLDVGAILRGAVPFSGEPRIPDGRALKLIDVDELESMQAPSMLVAGYVPERSFVVLYGRPGARKSFLALDMALSVATGRPWHGREVRKGSVVYLAAEGQAGMKGRVAAWRQSHGKGYPKPDMKLILQHVNIVQQLSELKDLLSTVTGISLIVIDTLARTFGGGDENSTRDMNTFVAAIDQLREATGACILVVHHSGKDDSKGARGSTVLFGACDTEMEVKKVGIENVILRTTKQKDAEEARPLTLRAVGQEVVDLDGTVASSCVLVCDEDVREGKESEEKNEEDGDESEGGRIGPLGNMIMDALANLDPGTSGISLIGLSKQIGKQRANVNKSIKKLVAMGLVREVGHLELDTKLYNLSEKFNS
jgi:hypothetical protein